MHSHGPHHHSQPAPAPAPDPLDPRAARLARLGGIAVTTWYLGGFVLLLFRIGPSNAVQGWMSSRWGWDSPIIAFLPAFALLALPVVILQFLPLQTGNPFIRGAQAALNPARDPARLPRPLPDAEIVVTLRRASRILLALAALSLAAGGVAFLLVAPLPAHAGEPLPQMTAAQVLARAGALPSHAQLLGHASSTRPVWVRYWSIRQTSYEDIYFPLDEPEPHGGAPTRLLGLASFVRGYGDAPDGRRIVLELPMDGSLASIRLPGWQRAALAARGIVVGDRVLLFRQDRTLAGRYPSRDWIGGSVMLIFGGAGAAVFLLGAVSCMVRQWRLLKGWAGAKPERKGR